MKSCDIKNDFKNTQLVNFMHLKAFRDLCRRFTYLDMASYVSGLAMTEYGAYAANHRTAPKSIPRTA